jgi:hypothetical protein
MITVEQLRAEFKLDVLTEDELNVLNEVESKIKEAAALDKDHIVFNVTAESYPKYFILNTRVGNLLTDSGYRIGLVKQEKNDESQLEEQYGALISFAGNR